MVSLGAYGKAFLRRLFGGVICYLVRLFIYFLVLTLELEFFCFDCSFGEHGWKCLLHHVAIWVWQFVYFSEIARSWSSNFVHCFVIWETWSCSVVFVWLCCVFGFNFNLMIFLWCLKLLVCLFVKTKNILQSLL